MSCSIIEQLVSPRRATCHRCHDASAVSGTLKQLLHWNSFIYGTFTALSYISSLYRWEIYTDRCIISFIQMITLKVKKIIINYCTLFKVFLRLRDINVCIMVYKTTEFYRFTTGKVKKNYWDIIWHRFLVLAKHY